MYRKFRNRVSCYILPIINKSFIFIVFYLPDPIEIQKCNWNILTDYYFWYSLIDVNINYWTNSGKSIETKNSCSNIGNQIINNNEKYQLLLNCHVYDTFTSTILTGGQPKQILITKIIVIVILSSLFCCVTRLRTTSYLYLSSISS